MNNTLDFEKLIQQSTRVLVINPLNTYWSYQITSEAALRARNKTSNVRWINVASIQKKKFEINRGDHISWLKYKDPNKRLQQVLRAANVSCKTPISKNRKGPNLPEFNSVKELRNFKFCGINLGAMVFSAVASAKHSTSFTMDDIREFSDHFFRTGFDMYYKIESEILEFRPEIILTINDRVLGASIGLALASIHEVDSRVLYWGSQPDRIQDYIASLYDSREWQLKIKSKWEVSPPHGDNRLIVENKVSQLGVEISTDSKLFLSGQIKGQGITKRKKTIVFYAQSEHEHSPIFIESIEGRFANQYEAFVALQDVCLRNDIQLILKYHPTKFDWNDANEMETKELDWSSISINNSVIQLPKNSKIDTYQLIEDSDINLVWNSNVGIESIARGKPTIVVGDAHWLDLGWGIHAWEPHQLEIMVCNGPKILPMSTLEPWVWYLMGFGVEMEFAELTSGLKVCGQQIMRKKFVYEIYSCIRQFFN